MLNVVHFAGTTSPVTETTVSKAGSGIGVGVSAVPPPQAARAKAKKATAPMKADARRCAPRFLFRRPFVIVLLSLSNRDGM
jgi:hypothetical protein